MTLSPQDVQALQAVSALLREDGWPFIIVGARAPWILVAGQSWRVTRDIDAVVRAPSWEAFERLAERLKAIGFSRTAAHHFISPQGAEVDLVPYGDGISINDTIVWPDGMVMSALGLEEAFAASVEREVAPGLNVRVVTAPALVILKIVAYQDRPHERSKDLADLVEAFERYEEDDGRRFDLVDATVDDTPIAFEEAGAYFLGVDAAQLARPKSREVIRAFLARFTDEYAGAVSRLLGEEKRLQSESRRAQVYRLFRVFGAGFEAL